MNHKRSFFTSLLTLLIVAIVVFGLANPSKSLIQTASGLTITAHTDQQSYRQRQSATVSGNVTLGGSPATDLVVLVEVSNPSGYGPYAFRTLQLGNPTGPWLLNITSIYISDMNDNPIDTIKAGSFMKVGMNVFNLQNTALSFLATITVYDANMVALSTPFYWASSVDPISPSGSGFQLQVPNSACSGRAVIIGCVYSNEPASGGIAYAPESPFYYCISRTQTGLFGITQPLPPSPQNTPGAYTDPIRLPSNPRPGRYSVYVFGQSSPSVFSSATTNFTVQSTNGIPPQASFAYWPPLPSINHSVSFDGSSSSPEGYNDIITRYEWDFGDGTPHYIRTGNPADPTATHVYTTATTRIVTLNVTNNEGLWCTTSKPITIGLGFGPTANFTWVPPMPVINETTSFDASTSTPGDYSTLVSYAWNFSDGTGIFNVSTPQTTHSFTQPKNYNVTLTVLDSVGRTASASAIIQVQNATIKKYDVNKDGVIDGSDLAIVAWSFGSWSTQPPPSRWNPLADVNGDLVVDGGDLSSVARHYGEDP